MNNRLSLEFGQTYARIPLKKSPHIVHGDALETDWATVLSPEKCSYVLGNPPFIGAKYQSKVQRAQMHRIACVGKSGGTLDYVTAWYITAAKYLQRSSARIGFVATNSITQGEQVAQLWPMLFQRHNLEIIFAHRTFAWGSDARGRAHVHVVILGLARRADAPKERRLFSYNDINCEPHESRHVAISPYLFDAGSLSQPHLVVKEAHEPLNGLPRLIIGSKPIDDGQYIFTSDERVKFLAAEPKAASFFRPYVGSEEFLNGGHRWILALHNVSPEILKALPKVRERISAVRAYRSKSKSKPTRVLAATPTLYHVNVIPTAAFLVIPEVSSERREYVPIGWMEPPIIPSNLVRIIENADKCLFGLLTSAMHMSWLRYIGGRLESRYRYSIGLVYNTFPVPPVPTQKLTKLEPLAQAVLDARASHPGSTLSNLYDPDLMPPDLRKAHTTLDRAVDRLYRQSGFSSDRERVEHLLGLYEKMIAPITAVASRIASRQRKPARLSANVTVD